MLCDSEKTIKFNYLMVFLLYFLLKGSVKMNKKRNMMYGKFYGQEHIPYPDDPEDLKDPETIRTEQIQKLKNDTLISIATIAIYGMLIFMFLESGLMLFALSHYGPEYMFFFYALCPVFSVLAIIWFLVSGRRNVSLELTSENIMVIIDYELLLVILRQLMLIAGDYASIIIIPYIIIAVAGVVYVYVRSDIHFKVKRWMGWLIGYFVFVDFIVAGTNATV